MADKNDALRSVVTLAAIAVVCGLLLSVLNALLFVEKSADDLKNEYFAGYVWTSETLSEDTFEGARVTLAARGEKAESPTYIGLLVVTVADGKLGSSTYAVYINAQTDCIEKAFFVEEGATGGFTWEYAASQKKAAEGGAVTGATALAGLAADENSAGASEWKDFEDFYVKIDSPAIFSDYGIPAKTGATKSVTATFNAFKAAAGYYYANYVLRGQS